MLRHSDVVYFNVLLCKLANLRYEMEGSLFCRGEKYKSDQKRTDTFIYNFDGKGTALSIDVPVLGQFAKNHSENNKPLVAAIDRKMSKISKYFQQCKGFNIIFRPFVVGTYGGIPQDFLETVFKLLIGKII